MLQIFALFWVMFGINCTRINQSQPRNISLYIISIGNSIISSAITDKQARVSFKKLQNSASPKDERYLRFLKTHECLFSVIAREIILLLINNIKRKCSNKHFVLTTSDYASALILEFLRLKKSCLQKPWLKVLCTTFQHTLEFVL